jgi:hypothetical protein
VGKYVFRRKAVRRQGFLAHGGRASDMRVRTKGIELIILNSPIEELKGSQESRASHEACRRTVFRQKTWNSHGVRFLWLSTWYMLCFFQLEFHKFKGY